jgi:hypothetical protein
MRKSGRNSRSCRAELPGPQPASSTFNSAALGGKCRAISRKLQQFVDQGLLRIGQARVFVGHPQAMQLNPGRVTVAERV